MTVKDYSFRSAVKADAAPRPWSAFKDYDRLF